MRENPYQAPRGAANERTTAGAGAVFKNVCRVGVLITICCAAWYGWILSHLDGYASFDAALWASGWPLGGFTLGLVLAVTGFVGWLGGVIVIRVRRMVS
jgi:hypothetical protein